MARNGVSKSCLMVELCFHYFLHFNCVTIYILALTTSSVLAIRKNSISMEFRWILKKYHVEIPGVN